MAPPVIFIACIMGFTTCHIMFELHLMRFRTVGYTPYIPTGLNMLCLWWG